MASEKGRWSYTPSQNVHGFQIKLSLQAKWRGRGWNSAPNNFSRLVKSQPWFGNTCYRSRVFSFMQTWTRLGALLHGAVDSSYHFSMESLHYYTISIISFMLLSHPSLVSRRCLHGNSSCFALFIWAGESSAAPGHLGDIIWKRLLYTMETLQQSPFQESSVTEHRKCISLMCHCPEILNRWHDWSSFI